MQKNLKLKENDLEGFQRQNEVNLGYLPKSEQEDKVKELLSLSNADLCQSGILHFTIRPPFL